MSYDRTAHAIEQIAWGLAESAAAGIPYGEPDGAATIRGMAAAPVYQISATNSEGTEVRYDFSPTGTEWAMIQERAVQILHREILKTSPR